MSALQSVAVNLQNWRQRRGISVSALARAANVSKSTVSELERHHGNPSLDTLWALAKALDIPLGFLFSDHDGGPGIRVVRQDDASVVRLEQPGYLARLMAGWDVSGAIELYVLEIAEGTRRDSDSHGFGVVEYAIAMDGRVDIGLMGESAALGPGDLITFPADQPHHYEAIDGPARVIAIHQYPRGRPEPVSENGETEREVL
jgi:XRE family transcriptional regulator, regulator of sulfur utilization